MSESEFSPEVVALLWARAFAACERCGRGLTRGRRGFEWSVHHRSARGMGGSNDPVLGAASNGLVLCGHGTSGCHGWVESHRASAILTGLLVPLDELPRHVPVALYEFGQVLLDDVGGVVRL